MLIALLILLQAQDPLPAGGDLVGGGTAHSAQAEDDGVVEGHGESSGRT